MFFYVNVMIYVGIYMTMAYFFCCEMDQATYRNERVFTKS